MNGEALVFPLVLTSFLSQKLLQQHHGAKMKKCQNHPCDTFTQKKRISPNKNPKELNQQLQLQKAQKLLA
jgi:hypothetical protein